MPKTDNRSALMREGCQSYHKALFAVAQFRREIQKLFRETLNRRAAELAEAMKLEKKVFIDGVKDYRDPPKDDPNTASAEVGLRMPEKEVTWTFWVYLYLEEPAWDYPTPALYAQLRLKERGLLRARLDGLRNKVTFQGDRLAWIDEPISIDESFDLQGSLDKLLDRWISVWREAGGIEPLLPRITKTDSTASK